MLLPVASIRFEGGAETGCGEKKERTEDTQTKAVKFYRAKWGVCMWLLAAEMLTMMMPVSFLEKP